MRSGTEVEAALPATGLAPVAERRPTGNNDLSDAS